MNSSSTTHLNNIFCLIGPSGTGKDAVAQRIPLPQIISYRTRNIRVGEENGVHGHFISEEEFMQMKKQDLWVADTLYAGNYYGITQGELIHLEESPLLYVCDWEGVEKLKEGLTKIEGYQSSQIITIFLYTPRNDLESRMIRQGRDREEVKVRLDRADRDYAVSNKCDHVVINSNGELASTAGEVMKIILKETFN